MIYRAKRQKHFTVISNEVFAENNLSFQAIGLLSFVLSKPDAWQINARHLSNATKNTAKYTGTDGVYAILNELRSKGFVHLEHTGNNGYAWTVYDAAHTFEPDRAKPDRAKPDRAKPDTYKELNLSKYGEDNKNGGICSSASENDSENGNGNGTAQESPAESSSSKSQSRDKPKKADRTRTEPKAKQVKQAKACSGLPAQMPATYATTAHQMRGYTAEQAEFIYSRFADHFADKTRTESDWMASWSKWIADERMIAPANASNPSQNAADGVYSGDMRKGGGHSSQSDIERYNSLAAYDFVHGTSLAGRSKLEEVNFQAAMVWANTSESRPFV